MPKKSCDHCNLIYDENMLIVDNLSETPKYFCCKGCQGVFHLLRNEGLENFYDRKGTTKLTPPKIKNDDLKKFDMNGFKDKYIKEKDGFYEISLIITGIHCAACIWLNEKVLHQSDGIIEANISQASNKAKILWDPSTICLSKIIEIIRSIGYNAHPYDSSLQEKYANAQRREYYSKLIVGIFTTMNIMWIAIAHYVLDFNDSGNSSMKSIFTFAEFLLATPTLFYTGSVFFKGAFFGIKNRFVSMDLLIATGATLAYIYSIYVMLSGTGNPYFDSVTMIITFVFAGKYLEVLMKKKAVDTLDSISGSLPNEVLVVKGDEKVFVNIENIVIGDIIELKAGEKVAIDGICKSGEGSFDEASLSGESLPVFKQKMSKIISGTICLDSLIRYEATETAKNSTISKIALLLEDAMSKKPRIEQLANQISGKFSATILSIAFLTLLFWWHKDGFTYALMTSISVIIIACPCALGLATPVTTLVGLGVTAKKGVLFKETKFLELMAKCNTLVLDKTGTITQGTPVVIEAQEFNEYDKNLLYSLVKSSIHPVSIGVASYLQKTNTKLKELYLQNVKNIEAKGVEAYFDGKKILGGSARFLKEHNFVCKEDSGTSYWFAIDDKICAKFILKDMPRVGTKEAIGSMRKMGIDIIMLTGDNETAAKDIAKTVGIEKFEHSLLPHEKAQYIEKLKQSGKKVVMAGDGINDTIALAKSDIGISIGSGSDIAVNVSDVVLMSDNLASLKIAFKASRRTYKTIIQNITFSLMYNCITIPLAVSGHVVPLIAAISMSLSSIVVVGNALRIKMDKELK